MTKKSINTLLEGHFQKTSKEDWLKTVTAEIKNNNSIEALSYKNKDGIAVAPVYDKNDITELQYLNAFNLRPSTDEFKGARSWFNTPCVTVDDETIANKLALNHLANGADGILFDLKKDDINILKLLENIDWRYCHISFKANDSKSFQQNIVTYFTDINQSNVLSGTIFLKEAIDLATLVQAISKEKNLHSLGIDVPASTPVTEIIYALDTAINLVDKITDTGIDLKRALEKITFSITITSDLFTEVAKLKTLRMLWFQVAQAFGHQDYQPADLHIHVRTEIWINEKFQPHGNMLNATMAAMAGVMGGCDSLTIIAEDETNTMMNRVARNVSSLLTEESHLDKVSDPTTGSYLIENLIDKMAQEVWERIM